MSDANFNGDTKKGHNIETTEKKIGGDARSVSFGPSLCERGSLRTVSSKGLGTLMTKNNYEWS